MTANSTVKLTRRERRSLNHKGIDPDFPGTAGPIEDEASFKQVTDSFAELKKSSLLTTADFAEFLRTCPPQEMHTALELVLEYARPRTANFNGCTCIFENGEACTRCSSFHSLFHDDMEIKNVPEITFAIDGFLQTEAITMIGGLPGHGKTWIMLSMVKSLLEGKPLFGYDGFKVSRPSRRVVYLCPESSLSPFAHRLKLFGLDKHVGGPMGGRLFCRTMSVDNERLTLDDLRLRHAIQGADVFLDTAVRFMTGDENSASDQREFSNTLFQLLACGARTITAAHHAPKGSENIAADRLTLESILRGTGELGAMVATCWALKQVDSATNRVYIRNVKARDFEACGDFSLQGRPHIDQTGDFKLVAQPGMALAPAAQQSKRKVCKLEEARLMRQAGQTHQQIAEHFKVALRTVERWESGGELGPPLQPDTNPTLPDIPLSPNPT